MTDLTQKQAEEILKKYASSNELYLKIRDHGRAVAKLALKIARDISKYYPIDLNLIKTASILHDIGRFKTNSPSHGYIGAEILRAEGLSEHAKIAETHVGVGITKQDIKKHNINIPLKDYIPQTLEQKIVCYADKLIAFKRVITIEDVKKRFLRELGKQHLKRIERLHNEIEMLRKGKGPIV